MMALKAIPTAVCRPLYEALSVEGAVNFRRGEFTALPGPDADGAGLAVPIGERSARAGVLTVCTHDRVRQFGPSDISFLFTVAFILAAVWERRRSEAVLMLRNRALEALDQGLMITDAQRLDNPLIYVNPAFERLSGYRADEVLGKNPRFLQGPETDWSLVRDLRKSLEAGRTFRSTIVNYRRDGSRFWNDLTVSAVRDADGRATHHVGILADVSERIRLEAQLRQAQKMEAIGHLTGGIAHDFNNLLAVIMGNSEILLEDEVDEELKETIRLVLETAERGAILTQRLLAFGRRQTLRPEPIEIGQVLNSLAQMLQRTLGEQVHLTTSDDGTGTPAHVDKGLFESAILNLAVNARDAMPEGGELRIASEAVSIAEGAVPELAAGRYVRVSVTDTGTGMPPDVLAQVFVPFFTTKEVGRGSGLGLAMVYGFAKQSGGHVTIESRLGVGTTVNVYLPVAKAQGQGDQVSPDQQSAVPKGSERILLVEDEAEVRRFVSRLLGRLGYAVIEAENAASAIGMLQGDDGVDLLFSDLILPGGLNGLKLMESARALRPEIKVLLTTGYTEEYERIAESSPALILRKPYKRQELALTLRKVLDSV
jgi:PAS domain S-box-containing protein